MTEAIGCPERETSRGYEIVKRGLDLVLSLAASIVFAPLVLVLMMLIVLKDPGSPVYLHKRVGQRGKPIKVMKLRTMRQGADHLEEMLTPAQLEEYKKEYKVDDDPRLIGWEKKGDGKTCFGACLRQFSLDEVPQIFWNVLIKGDLSLVGPRPILERELQENYSAAEQKLLLSVKPGITGYWQAYARNAAKYEDGKRQQMELWYVKHRSLWVDVKIMFATVGAVLGRSGV